MNPVHLHLVINHLPLFGMFFGAALLIAGLARQDRSLVSAAKVGIALVAAATIPTYLTGEPAAKQIEQLPAISEALISAHEQAAVPALVTTLSAGALALFLLFRYRQSAKLHVALGALCCVAVGLMGWVANLGGKIQHAELRGASSTAVDHPAPGASSSDGPDLPRPPELHSSAGRLDVTLTAGASQVNVAGKTFVSNVFNGLYIPPVLVVKRGDEVRLRFVNEIAAADVQIHQPQPSNLHTHGMAISPLQPADNAYIGVPSGAQPAESSAHGHQQEGHAHQYETPISFADGGGFQPPNAYEYRWSVPKDHARGPHWYHPHAHGLVEGQVLSGLSGMLIVDGFLDAHYPELVGLEQRYLVLKDIELPGAKEGAPLTKTLNGTLGGVIRMRPGEVQVWTLGNVGANAFFDLAIDGHPFVALAHDANTLRQPQPVGSAFLPPGARITLAVTGGAPGVYAIRSKAVDTGPAGDPNPEVVLATLVIAGAKVSSQAVSDRLVQPAARIDDAPPTAEAVEKLAVTRKRTVTFSETADGKTFFIDKREFDANRDDVTVTVGDVEEWTVLNTTAERHVFHIHQLDFLVESINDSDPDAQGLRDTIDLPYARNGQPGQVVIKLPFTNPAIVGRFPFHCHILEHEDNGMMANLRVLPATAKPGTGR